MLEGTVMYYNARKGHGMITTNDKQFFFHRRNLETKVAEGDKVSFQYAKSNLADKQTATRINKLA